MEQSADAADISTSTSYRYFPAREDVVFDDDYDPVFKQVLDASSNDTLVTTVRAAVAAVAAMVGNGRDAALTRMKHDCAGGREAPR